MEQKYILSSECDLNANERMGMAIDLLSQTDRKSFSIAAVRAFLYPPCRLKQIEFVMCAYRRLPKAYISYAYLTDDVLQEFKDSQDRILDLSEWNEGEHLFIADFVCPKNDIWGAVRILKDKFSDNFTKTYYLNRRGKLVNYSLSAR